MKLNTGIMLVGLMLSFAAQGASFDCSKATTNLEKQICDNPAISKLDDEIGKLYQDTLNKADEKQKQRLVAEQKHWLKHTRNICEDEPCLKLAYWARQAELATFFDPKPPLYKHEADKADAIKQVLATAQLYPDAYIKDKRFCGQLFDDLKQMKDIRFVDPVVQAQSYEDPALDKWKRNCGTKPPLHFSRGCEPRIMNTIKSYKDTLETPACNKGFGIPPLKIYELPALKQGGKNRYIFYADDVYGSTSWEYDNIYTAENWERIKPKLGSGYSAGFRQFDPEKCEPAKNGTGIHAARGKNYNSLIVYQRQYYFLVLNEQHFSGSDGSASSWWLYAQAAVPSRSKEMKSCSWNPIAPESNPSTQGSK